MACCARPIIGRSFVPTQPRTDVLRGFLFAISLPAFSEAIAGFENITGRFCFAWSPARAVTRLAQEEIFQDELPLMRRKRIIADATRYTLVNGFRPGFALDYLVERIAIWTMKRPTCGHGVSPVTHSSHYPGKSF